MKSFFANFDSDQLPTGALEDFEDNGFIILQGLLEDTEIYNLVATVDALAAEEEATGMSHVYGENLQRVWNLLNKHEIFHRLILSPQINAWMEKLFDRPTQYKKFFLSSFQANILAPGAKSQKVHIDTPLPDPLPPYILKANTIWLLDDFTALNGGTEVIPGSHRLKRRPRPDEWSSTDGLVKVIAPRGSILITHGALWHRSGTNASNHRRRVLLGSFAASYVREIASEEDIVRCLSSEVRDRIPDSLYELIGGFHGIKTGGAYQSTVTPAPKSLK